MNEQKLAETLAKIDESQLAGDDGARTVSGESIKRLHSRRRARESSIALASVGFLAIVSTVLLRFDQDRTDPVGPERSFPLVKQDNRSQGLPEMLPEPDSKPDFELANVTDPAMNLELELVRESIAENLVKLARLGKTGGNPDSDWRQNLDFVLKNYPETIAAESARAEFGTVSESKTN